MRVTRALDRMDDEQALIEREKRSALVETDPEMTMRGLVEAAAAAGEMLSYQNEGLARRTDVPPRTKHPSARAAETSRPRTWTSPSSRTCAASPVRSGRRCG